MAFLFEEVTGGDISFEPASTVRRWRAMHTPDTLPGGDFFSYVASAAMHQTPATYFVQALGGVLYRQDIQVHENHYAKDYEITVPYGRRKREAGAYQITVDQTGGSVHVTAGKRISGWGPNGGGTTRETNASGQVTVAGTEPLPGSFGATGQVNNGGLIGVDGLQVHGVDIPVSETKLSVSYRHPAGQLSREYERRTGRLVGYVNSDKFLGYEPGEVKYLGGVFTQTDTEASAAYSFAVSYNITTDDQFKIGTNPPIGVDTKDGWDVISPVYKTEDDEATGRTTRKLQYVEVIRPAGREYKAFADSTTGFGWGGEPEDD